MARAGRTPYVHFQSMSFSYESAAEPLLVEVSISLAPGWVGVVGPNGSGKTTLLRLATGELEPTTGLLERRGRALYCAQRTDLVPDGLVEMLTAADNEAHRLVSLLGLDYDWPWRWETLSHGERKRAQLAVALWQRPEVLALDEPDNHLDAPARRAMLQALEGYDGLGLLVSHQRDLLDHLCRCCLFVRPPEVRLRPGGVSAGLAQQQLEEESELKRRSQVEREARRLKREAMRRADQAARQQARRSKKGLALQDHDARFKKNLARLTGRDGAAGRSLRQLDGRLARVEEQLADARTEKRHQHGISLAGQQAVRDNLLWLDEGNLPLGDGRRLSHPALHLRPTDRVALTGPNGAGKSTLVRMIIERLVGTATRTLYIPQEVTASNTVGVLERVRRLNRADLGHVMALVRRLGSDPERVLASALLSPGELRKLLLAEGMLDQPNLLVLDEPTNHMDLISVACLEQALGETECALLLVSHDRRFVETLTSVEWRIRQRSSTENRLELVSVRNRTLLPGLC